MSFEFKEYELVKVQEIECERRAFDVQEEIQMGPGVGDILSLHLSCGDPQGESWRTFRIEFVDEADYEAFCGLLREANDIELG